jgi:hypothetical protein
MSFQLTRGDRLKLRGVHPDLVQVVERAAELSDRPFRVLEGLRTLERQRTLKAKGASQDAEQQAYQSRQWLRPRGRYRAAGWWTGVVVLAPLQPACQGHEAGGEGGRRPD